MVATRVVAQQLPWAKESFDGRLCLEFRSADLGFFPKHIVCGYSDDDE
jgi:hypothetical protein